MKIFKMAAVTAALVVSTSTNAATISLGNLTRDTSSDIVSDNNGYEWMMWNYDEKLTHSQLLSEFENVNSKFYGWNIADSSQFTAFLDNAGFTGSDLSNPACGDLDTSTVCNLSSTSVMGDEIKLWELMFNYEKILSSSHQYNRVFFTSPTKVYNNLTQDYPVGEFQLGWGAPEWIGYENREISQTDVYTMNDIGNVAIRYALVREVSAVPIPAAVWLFGSGLIGLAGLARRKKA